MRDEGDLSALAFLHHEAGTWCVSEAARLESLISGARDRVLSIGGFLDRHLLELLVTRKDESMRYTLLLHRSLAAARR